MGAQDWINDLTGAEDGEDDRPSLFEDNFRKLVEDDDLDSITVSTLESQLDRIDDPELLAKAVERDGRTTAEDAYKSRIGEINAEQQPDSSDESGEEPEPEPEPEVEEVEDDGDADQSEGSESVSEPEDVQDDASPSDRSESADTGSSTESELPSVDVSSLAPSAVSREQAAAAEKERSMLVWGPEGSGKTHVAHSAPEPIAYIDTEGKASELASKFDKEIVYWEATNYDQAEDALDEAIDLLDAYAEHGVMGTIVVDSMTKMWEYAKVSWAKLAYQTDKLSEVNFKSALQGEDDWKQIKARHNEEFRDRILDLPYHAVFTAGRKENYDYDGSDFQTRWQPDGERWNKYAVKEVVNLRVGPDGKTVGDLRKAARTRYSFVGLEWPTWDKIYDAIDRISEAEQQPGDVDVTQWEFDVVDGQPISGPSDDEEEEDDE